MKLRALYSDRPSIFPRIEFRDGLNVIFARVQTPKAESTDSHNLGKTFLIRVLDFVLLSDITKDHPFRIHGEEFNAFTFFLEVETHAGTIVTIRRAVTGRRAISLHVMTEPYQDLRSREPDDWAHPGISLAKAKGELNKLLGLSSIEPFTFRKGLGYFLRRQDDYQSEFMISRFGRGKDRDWKPFMALLLGFDHDLVSNKYGLDQEEEIISSALKGLHERGGQASSEYDELKGLIDIKSDEIATFRRKVNNFDFADVESDLTRETVREIESEIANLNEDRYNVEREQDEIDHALSAQFGFDLAETRTLFEEAQIAFPESLARSYEQLLELNRRISDDRKERLGQRMSQLRVSRQDIDGRLAALNTRRIEALRIVFEKETLEKFRQLQQKLLKDEEDLNRLRRDLTYLDQASQLRQRLLKIEEDRRHLVEAIRSMVESGNELYTSVRRWFASLARSILFVPAVLSTAVNKKGNLEFRTRIVEGGRLARETAEGEGTSYKKVLCAAFDLALLASRSKERFYRFVYHDGIFEGLDNRRKVTLLKTVRETCSKNDTQYILTVIDSDLPRDDKDNKLLFKDVEVIRQLHDDGDDGRLFRMPAF